MRKIITTILVLILVSDFVAAFSNDKAGDNDVLSISVRKDNLFLHIITPHEYEAQKVVINLNKGKRIKLGSGLVEDGQMIFYLDSKEAYKLKKFGVESISIFDGINHHQIRFSSDQTEKIARSLP